MKSPLYNNVFDLQHNLESHNRANAGRDFSIPWQLLLQTRKVKLKINQRNNKIKMPVPLLHSKHKSIISYPITTQLSSFSPERRSSLPVNEQGSNNIIPTPTIMRSRVYPIKQIQEDLVRVKQSPKHYADKMDSIFGTNVKIIKILRDALDIRVPRKNTEHYSASSCKSSKIVSRNNSQPRLFFTKISNCEISSWQT